MKKKVSKSNFSDILENSKGNIKFTEFTTIRAGHNTFDVAKIKFLNFEFKVLRICIVPLPNQTIRMSIYLTRLVMFPADQIRLATCLRMRKNNSRR